MSSRAEQIALLRAFYADHDPDKPPKEISDIVDKRRGANACMAPEQWRELDRRIEKKYGWPIQPTGARLKELWRTKAKEHAKRYGAKETRKSAHDRNTKHVDRADRKKKTKHVDRGDRKEKKETRKKTPEKIAKSKSTGKQANKSKRTATRNSSLLKAAVAIGLCVILLLGLSGDAGSRSHSDAAYLTAPEPSSSPAPERNSLPAPEPDAVPADQFHESRSAPSVLWLVLCGAFIFLCYRGRRHRHALYQKVMERGADHDDNEDDENDGGDQDTEQEEKLEQEVDQADQAEEEEEDEEEEAVEDDDDEEEEEEEDEEEADEEEADEEEAEADLEAWHREYARQALLAAGITPHSDRNSEDSGGTAAAAALRHAAAFWRWVEEKAGTQASKPDMLNTDMNSLSWPHVQRTGAETTWRNSHTAAASALSPSAADDIEKGGTARAELVAASQAETTTAARSAAAPPSVNHPAAELSARELWAVASSTARPAATPPSNRNGSSSNTNADAKSDTVGPAPGAGISADRLVKGASVELFSNSANAWLRGKVVDVNAEKQMVCLSYKGKSGTEMQKWLVMSSEHLRRLT